jgi:hypothetical membrane protein
MEKLPLRSTQPQSSQRLLAICGIVGPIFYTVVVFTLGLLQQGYNHVTQLMSELGAVSAPYALIMNTAGFALLGLLIIAFAFGLDRGISNGKGSKIGPALVAVSGAALVMMGIFPHPITLHIIFAMIFTFAMILAQLAIYSRLRRDSQWQGYQYYSLATAIVAISAVCGFSVLEQWMGALQRVSMGVLLLWMEVMSIKLLRLFIKSTA